MFFPDHYYENGKLKDQDLARAFEALMNARVGWNPEAVSDNMVKRDTFYRLVDRLTSSERRRFGKVSEGLPDIPLPETPPCGRVRVQVLAVWTGEKRQPKAGEWYLSGAEVEAYRVPNDLSTVFHIARLVKVEEELILSRRVVESDLQVARERVRLVGVQGDQEEFADLLGTVGSLVKTKADGLCYMAEGSGDFLSMVGALVRRVETKIYVETAVGNVFTFVKVD